MNNGPKQNIAPPKWADRFLSWFCRDELLEEVRGDLHEYYWIERAAGSRFKASRQYWFHVIHFLRPFAMKKLRYQTHAILTVTRHFRQAIRGHQKKPLFHFLNAFGLAIGLAACLLIALFVSKEYAYDKAFANGEQIYRIEEDILSASATRHIVRSAPAIAPGLKNEIPGIRSYVRMRHGDVGDPQLMTYEEHSFFENRIFYVDSTFFEIFNFPLARGVQGEALMAPNSVVITAETAKKYFGNADPIGKTLLLDGNRGLRVTGVLEPIDFLHHLDFDFLFSMTTYEVPSYGSLESWAWTTFYSYVLLDDQVSPEAIEAQVPDILVKNWREDAKDKLRISLKPLQDVYLHSPNDDQVLGRTSSHLYSRLLIIIGIFIFLNCVFNHINLATFIALGRAKEIGVRKTLGATKGSLKNQFLWETVFHISLALILSSLLAFVLAALAESYMGWQVFELEKDYLFILKAAGIMLLILVPASSWYLAFNLSGSNPSYVLRGTGSGPVRGGLMRKMLIAAQLCISFLLLFGAFIVVQQLKFIFEKDLGFDSEKVVMLELNGVELMSNYDKLKTALLANPNVEKVGAARLGMEGRHGSYRVFPLEGEPSEDGHQMSIYPVQYDFFEALDMTISEGRSYSKSFEADTAHQFIINEVAKKQLGFEDPVGKHIMLNGQGGMYGRIVGVVEDFHFKSLAFQLDPIVIFFRQNATNFVYVKLNEGSLSESLASLEATWKEVNPDYPFQSEIMDDRLNRNYALDQQFQDLINFFSVIILLITIAGIFGMSAFSVKQRIKELTVRRILGAKLSQLIRLLSADFGKIVLITFAIATPLSIYASKSWMARFAYQTEIPVNLFIIILAFVIGLTLSIIAFNALRVSGKNLLSHLRNE